MKKILYALVLFSNLTFGQMMLNQQNSKVTHPAKDHWKTYNDSGYSIRYPPAWELQSDGKTGVTFFISSPLESAEDKFRENVNLIIEDLTGGNIDLNQFVDISKEQIMKVITNSSIIESERIKGGSREHHKIIYTGDQGVFHLEFEQYYWMIGDKAYLLTFTAEKNRFTDWKETAEEILNSFVIKK
jgi:hypothetical protein